MTRADTLSFLECFIRFHIFTKDLIKELQKKYKNKFLELKEQEKIENEKNLKLTFPFDNYEEYFELQSDGTLNVGRWKNVVAQKMAYAQCNIFKKVEEAHLERQKRELLMKFKQFKNKCNGGWKPDFNNFSDRKYFIIFTHRKGLCAEWSGFVNYSSQFGYFKNGKDCERAIELFGDEIKRLFMEEEYE